MLKSKMNQKGALRTIITLMFILVGVLGVTAQVDFKPRTSSKAPAPYTGVKNYNLQGDFTMIGNTNLTLKDYYESGDAASNSKPMIYVDVDGDNNTKNSSSAQLLLPGGECTEIIYAGLYWTGRAQRSNNSSWTIGGLDKRQVKLKKAGSSYQNITANSVGGQSEILFPTNNNSYIYTAYADVTDYVRKNGVGNYFVADIALAEGSSSQDGTGYFGGWGMVVIYKNTSLKWRNITVFDGYGYMTSSVGSKELPVSGFQAAQHGDVKIKMGMMAGEGDVSIPGDYFDIKNVAGNWRRIKKEDGTTSTPGTSTPNFFNSSILTGGNSRSPNLKNNTGIDIVMFDLDNPGNSIIKNNQSSSTFRFGSTQDTYVIHNIVFAVDAYVPEVVGENKPSLEFGIPPINGETIVPGQEFEFKLDIYNKGNEAVNNTKIEIPIPSNLHYVSSTPSQGTGSIKIPDNTIANWVAPVGAPTDATPENTAGGKLVWDIGTLIKDDSKSILQGFLKYRLRVSDNCVLLSTGTCGLEVRINGKISGTGATSGTNVSSDLVREYGAGACAGPVYDDFISTIKLSAGFLQGCNPPVEDGIMQFKAFCEVPLGGFPRAQVKDIYPLGAKFFSVIPTSYLSTEGLVDGDFPVNADGSKKMYYVMVPGMAEGCYARLEISVDKVTTEPTAQNIMVCFGEEIVLRNSLSQIGVSNQYALIYFDKQNSAQPFVEEPRPTTVGTHTYWVAEGKDGCFGPKKEFTITINALPEIVGMVDDIEVCTNFDASATVKTSTATGLTYVWEYSTTGGTTWETLQNSTFSNKIVLTDGTIEVKYADAQINGTKVRLKISNSQCAATSNVFEIKVKDCPAVTNPMLLNKGIQ
ncbi:conserved repeat domain-containing protein [Sphingobacterium nematocida]|uniref:Conserved repeat domain-containing protein n=1 Tax=Sphingobacterium nematocida TaxID=1513896 RepID=A0A1T5GU05_9SPHI|nr:DUF11 domain-containing protein [Sphingobacterium nematocida]SKC11858.1 conserved repeat domain-containing protein [Sphingobacterium nematocida]